MPRRRLRAALVPLQCEQEVIVEIEHSPAACQVSKRTNVIEYSPIESVCATPINVNDDPAPSVEWSKKEELELGRILAESRTMVIHWDEVARVLSARCGRGRSPQECEDQHVEMLTREYANSVKRGGVKRRNSNTAAVSETPADEFKARDPTRRFKMTKLLAERTFKDHPTNFISPIPDGPKARRYSFINDTLGTDLEGRAAKTGPTDENRAKRSALSFLKEVLPDRSERQSLKLDDDRFLQKLKGVAASKSGKPSLASTTKRRLQQHDLNHIVSGLAAQTDNVNEQCVTQDGLTEELIALSHKEDEYKLLLDEIENAADNTIIH